MNAPLKSYQRDPGWFPPDFNSSKTPNRKMDCSLGENLFELIDKSFEEYLAKVRVFDKSDTTHGIRKLERQWNSLFWNTHKIVQSRVQLFLSVSRNRKSPKLDPQTPPNTMECAARASSFRRAPCTWLLILCRSNNRVTI